MSTPGGGGYGDPYQRESERVLRDVIRGYYTVQQAYDLFAVVIDEKSHTIDQQATIALRTRSEASEAIG